MASVPDEHPELAAAHQELEHLRAQVVELQAQHAALATEQRHFAEQIRALERTNGRHTHFMGGDFLMCMNTMLGFTDLLIRQKSGRLDEHLQARLNDARQLEYLQEIQTAGRWLLAMHHAVRDLTQLEAGWNPPRLTTFSLLAVLQDGVAQVQEPARRFGINVSLTAEPAVEEIEADEQKVKQVVRLLLQSVVDFTPDGGRVALTARSLVADIQVAVTTSGPSLAPTELAQLFDKFAVSLNRPRRERVESTGVGLPLVRGLVELHGGRVWADSAVGEGITFYLPLPRLASSAGA